MHAVIDYITLHYLPVSPQPSGLIGLKCWSPIFSPRRIIYKENLNCQEGKLRNIQKAVKIFLETKSSAKETAISSSTFVDYNSLPNERGNLLSQLLKSMDECYTFPR